MKVLIIILLFVGISLAKIVYVPADISSIQGGINLAENGDTVSVAPGEYFENINFNGKAIFLSSYYILDHDTSYISSTIINGSEAQNSLKASVVTFSSDEDTSSVLNGFTITGGTGTQYTGLYSLTGGGGIFILSGARISNNHIINNNLVSTSNSVHGAGIFIDTGSENQKNVIVKSNLVANNKAIGQSGVCGGGISVLRNGNVLISNNVIKNNSVEAKNPIDFISGGGGLHIVFADSPELINNVITGNGAPYGGGIVAWAGVIDLNFRLINNTIIDNSASLKGGGVYLYNGHCTVINNIFWDNTAPEDPDIFYRGEMNMSYSITQKIFPGIGNIQSDPLFENSEYHLSEASPAIDAGNPDPKFYDIADPENLSVPLAPAKGSLYADMGAFGGNDTIDIEIEDYLVKKNFLKKKFDDMHYRFAYPTNYDSSSTYPLTIVLHGLGNQGTDNEKHLDTGLYWRINAQHNGYNDFTIVPQAPTSVWDSDEILETVYQLINETIRNFPIDTTKIVVNGFSKGGDGTTRLLTMYPKLFAAGIPISGLGKGDPIVYKHVPLWVYHGDVDPQVSVNSSRNIIKVLEETGLSTIYTEDVNEVDILEAINNDAKLFYSELKGAGHIIIRYCYDNANMFNWLQKQIRPLIHPLNSQVDGNYYQENMDMIHFRTEFSNPRNFQKEHTLIIENFDHEKIRNVTLYDDGMHGDSLSQDGVWGNYIEPFPEDNYRIGIEVKNLDKEEEFYFHDLAAFTTKGPVSYSHIEYTSSDTVANPGDVLKFKLFLKNNGTSAAVYNIETSLTQIDSCAGPPFFQKLPLDSLLVGETKEHNGYEFFIKIDAACTAPAIFPVQVDIYQGNYVFWVDTFYINVVTGIADDESNTHNKFALHQNYPNPFNPSTTIEFTLPKSEFVELKIYNILGKEVSTLVSTKLDHGNHSYTFDGTNLASGVYYYQLVAGDFIQTRKLLLVK